jgi:membrane fusion protein (multidrug efflux system)
LQGLREGERVITHGTLRVRPGQKVEVRAVDDGDRSLAEMLNDGAQAGGSSPGGSSPGK